MKESVFCALTILYTRNTRILEKTDRVAFGVSSTMETTSNRHNGNTKMKHLNDEFLGGTSMQNKQ